MPGSLIVLWSVLAVVVVLAVAATPVLVRRLRRGARDAGLGAADPDDRPLPAVVVNPTKLDDRGGARARIEAVCVELGWRRPLWLETTPEDPGAGQAAHAVERGADVVLACGGDGTVRAVAQALAGSGVAMALLPAGTGNLLARNLGMTLDPVAATRIALTGDDRPIDVGWVRFDDDVEERAFLVMAGTGFDASIMAGAPEALKARVGPLAYVVSGVRAMRGRQTRVEISLDSSPPLRRRTRSVVVGNCGSLLGGLVLMPKAELDDGLLDVVSLAPRGPVGWVAVALRVLTRRRHGHRRVEHWQTRTVRIRAEQPLPAQLDGDPIGDATELDVRVQPGALALRVATASGRRLPALRRSGSGGPGPEAPRTSPTPP